MASRIFLTALELDVFKHLADDRLSASQLAARMDSDKRATEVLLNALVGMELLKKSGNLFENSSEVAGFLISDSPHYRGGVLRHNGNLWEGWSHLTEIVRTGKHHKREWTQEMSRDLAAAMKQQARSAADRLVRVVDCSNVTRMLDLGGGTGEHAITLARRNPRMEVVIFDKDEQALEMGKEEVEKSGLQNRISMRKGDFNKDDFGSAYDLVLLSSIVCLLGEEENRSLLGKVKASLNDKGRVVIWDTILDDSKTKPAPAAIFAVRMVVVTPNGMCYSNAEVKGWLSTLGFRHIHQIPIENSQLIIGSKQD